jgi:anti-anti-sigma regulatory factor
VGSFEVRRCEEPDGALRLILVGELDMGAADDLGAGLARVEPDGRPVRLDLSELRFIDCRGVRAVLAAVTDARTRQVSRVVGRMVEFAGVASVLWPLDAAAAAA